MKILDENGLLYLWQKIKAFIENVTGIPKDSVVAYDGEGVPEGYEEVNEYEDITSDFMTLQAGFSLTSYSRVFKNGKHIVGNIVVKAESGFPVNSGSKHLGILKTEYAPSQTLLSFAGLGSEWTIINIGYMYMDTNLLIANCTSADGGNYAKIHFDYICN